MGIFIKVFELGNNKEIMILGWLINRKGLEKKHIPGIILMKIKVKKENKAKYIEEGEREKTYSEGSLVSIHHATFFLVSKVA